MNSPYDSVRQICVKAITNLIKDNPCCHYYGIELHAQVDDFTAISRRFAEISESELDSFYNQSAINVNESDEFATFASLLGGLCDYISLEDLQDIFKSLQNQERVILESDSPILGNYQKETSEFTYIHIYRITPAWILEMPTDALCLLLETFRYIV